mgnify:CR=1 FL=1
MTANVFMGMDDTRVEYRIDGGAVLASFGADSKVRADTAFVHQLFELGRLSSGAALRLDAAPVVFYLPEGSCAK